MTNNLGKMVEEHSLLEHTCRLEFKEPASHRLQTGIVGTISKASRSKDVLKKMILSGMTIARLNFSHETHELHAETIKLLQNAEEECSKEMGYLVQVALALDTKGPEIRTGLLEAGPNSQVELKVNDNIRLSTNRDLMDKGSRECIYVDYENIINVVQPGFAVYINDGAIKLIVKELGVDCIICQVERGGILGSRKKINLPGALVDLPAVSKKDISDIKFGLDQNIDFIFASSMRSASAVQELRTLLENQGKDIKIIAKIDCEQALHNVDEILAVADGILFATADVAIEIPSAKVFLAQKAITARCNRAGKPIIIATKVLESMRTSIYPKKAEVSDLGNAILDGADCVMLASETAIGQYPIETIKCASTICREAELALWHKRLFEDILIRNPSTIDATHSVAISAVNAAKNTLAGGIIVLTTSGKSAQLLAKYRPKCPILAVTRCSTTFKQSQIYRGVIPIMYTDITNKNWLEDIDARIQFGLNIAKRMKIIKTGDSVVIVSPWKDGGGFSNTMRLIYAFFEQEDFDCMLKTERKSTKKLSV